MFFLDEVVKQRWTPYDYAASSFWWITGSLAIPLNLILIYLIVFKSPKSLQLYSIFLINTTLGDLVFSMSCTLAQIRIIPNKWAFAYVSLGPAGWIGGSQGGYWAYCVMLHSLFYMFLCFPISFGFRYWILIRPAPEQRSCVIMCFCLWLVAFAQHICFICSESPPEEITAYLKENKPQYKLDHFFISGNHMIKSPLTSITLATIVLPMFPIYVMVCFFYKKVHNYLLHNKTTMSEGTEKGHRKLIQVLTIQASVPIFLVFPPITLYGLYHLEFIDVTVAEYLVYTIFSVIPLVQPIITMYYIKPYNHGFRRLFCRWMIRPMPAKSLTTVYGEKETHYSSTRYD